MIYQRKRRKPDLFSVLLIAVTLGMTATLAYQLHVYHEVEPVPVVTRAPTTGNVGG